MTPAPCRATGAGARPPTTTSPEEEGDLNDPPLPGRESLTPEQVTLARRVRSLAADIDRHQARISVLARHRADAIHALHASGLSIRRIARVVGTSPGPVEDALARARRSEHPDPATSTTDQQDPSEGDRP
jgi:DNA-directed RNA polymerase specialized sigma24 family protein